MSTNDDTDWADVRVSLSRPVALACLDVLGAEAVMPSHGRYNADSCGKAADVIRTALAARPNVPATIPEAIALELQESPFTGEPELLPAKVQPSRALKVLIGGEVGAGKTTLAILLRAFFEQQGIPVTVKDYDLNDPAQLNAANPEWQARRLEALKGRGVIVETHNFQRPSRGGA